MLRESREWKLINTKIEVKFVNKKNIGFHMVLVVHKIDIIGKILITDVTITCS